MGVRTYISHAAGGNAATFCPAGPCGWVNLSRSLAGTSKFRLAHAAGALAGFLYF